MQLSLILYKRNHFNLKYVLIYQYIPDIFNVIFHYIRIRMLTVKEMLSAIQLKLVCIM